jgi:hypothetical protein
MAGSRLSPFVACLAAGSLFVSSTGAVAATAARPLAVSASHQIDPWAALAALAGAAPVAALCGGTTPVDPAVAPPAGAIPGCVLPVVDVAAAPVQTAGPPPPTPVPPVEPVGGGLGIDPLYLALGALAIGALVYFLVIKKKHHDNDVSPT